MTTKVTIKTKIVVNGREYGSPDDLPDNLRDAYKAAMKSRNVGNSEDSFPGGRSGQIKFNGQEYATIEEMPADVRRLYELAIAVIDENHVPVSDTREAISHATPFAGLLNKNGVGVSRQASDLAPGKVPESGFMGSKSRLAVLVALILFCLLAFVLSGGSVSR